MFGGGTKTWVGGPVAYAGFRKGGGQKFQKIWEQQRSESEIVPLKFSPIFRPKLGEEQKKTKKTNRSSLKFIPIFRPKLGVEQKKVFTEI